MVVQACESDEFPFMRGCRAVRPCSSCTNVYLKLGLILPLTIFQCALLEQLNVSHCLLYLNSWVMVKAFEILCSFFNIRPNVSIFVFFLQMKLTRKIGS